MPSPSDVDINKFIIDHDENLLTDGDVVLTGYGPGGKEIAVEQPACLAKKVFDPASGNNHYWLKRATAGPEAGRLFNPHSPTFESSTTKRVNQRIGRGQYEFVKASRAAFEAYCRFLETDNLLHLRQAERE